MKTFGSGLYLQFQFWLCSGTRSRHFGGGWGGCPGARAALARSLCPPVPECCFEVTNKNKHSLKRGFIGKAYCKEGKGNL